MTNVFNVVKTFDAVVYYLLLVICFILQWHGLDNYVDIYILFLLFVLSADVCRGAGAVETAMSRKTDCQYA